MRGPIIRSQYPAISHVSVCAGECVSSALYNPARSVSHSGLYSVAGEEEEKLGDRLRHNPIHYSSAVRGKITIRTSNVFDLAYDDCEELEYKYIQIVFFSTSNTFINVKQY